MDSTILFIVTTIMTIFVIIVVSYHYEAIKNNQQLRRVIMATKQEVLDAISQEVTQVKEKLDAQTAQINDLNTQIQALKDQITNGVPITSADLDEIVAAVHDIFVPTV